MLTRMRLLKGATVLLYLGPLVAGLCGFGWGMVAPFAVTFVIWLMLLRPEQWPATPDEWVTGNALLAALTQVLSQIMLVAALFALGRGLGGLSGIGAVAVNPVVPLTISIAAIPLCRMLWDAREAASLGYFLDEEAEAAHADNAAGDAVHAVIPLLNFPDGAPDSVVLPKVAQLMNVPSAGLRLRALDAALARPDRSHAALRRALVLWATEPELVAPGHVPDSVNLAFSIAKASPDLLRLLVPRAMALVSAFPYRASGFPDPDALRASAEIEPAADPDADLPAHLRADLRDGLLALARVVETARSLPLHQPVPAMASGRLATIESRHA